MHFALQQRSSHPSYSRCMHFAPQQRSSNPSHSRCRQLRCSASIQSNKQTPHSVGRRAALLSIQPWIILGGMTYGSSDTTTIINSVLGAYGLPDIKQTGGTTWQLYDDFDNAYYLEWPRQGWVSRSNTLREGIYFSNFKTADKASVEIFPAPPPNSDFAYEVVERLLYPAVEVGGNSKLELPPRGKVKEQDVQIDGQTYTYISFPSETITRSGYQVRRKNLAVAAVRKGLVYSLVASARSDQYDKDKEAMFLHIIESFRLR